MNNEAKEQSGLLLRRTQIPFTLFGIEEANCDTQQARQLFTQVIRDEFVSLIELLTKKKI